MTRKSRAREAWITVRLAQPVAAGSRVRIECTYSGRPIAGKVCSAWVRSDSIVLLPAAIWHPTDLRSCTEFGCTATLPEAWVVARAGARHTEEVSAGRKTVRWREARPVFGASLAAGVFDRVAHDDTQGRVAVYWPATAPREATGEGIDAHSMMSARGQACLDAARSAYSTCTAELGGDGFAAFTLVLVPRAGRGFYGGNGTAALPLEALKDEGYSLHVAVARLVARNWWGGTVTGRSLAEKSDGGGWVVDAFSEYQAWESLRTRYGGAALIRYVEQLPCPRRGAAPLDDLSLREPLNKIAAEEARVSGAWSVRALAESVGTEAFRAACSRILAVYRHSTVSYTTIRQEFELTSDGDLRNLFDSWVQDDGAFDYTIADVEAVAGGVRVTLENDGDRPATHPVDVALVLDSTVDLRQVDCGAQGGSFVLRVDTPVARIVLDPSFQTPDVARANNVWPRQVWPVSVNAPGTGVIALARKREWTSPHADHLVVWGFREGTYEQIDANGPVVSGPCWNPSGRTLAFATREGCHRWSADSEGDVFLRGEHFVGAGWRDMDTFVVIQEQPEPKWLGLSHAGKVPFDGARERLPAPGSLRANAETGRIAFVSAREGTLWMLDPEMADVGSKVADGIEPVGEIAWTDDGKALLLLDRQGRLVTIREGETVEARPVALNLPGRQARFSPNAKHVAWVEVSGQLRIAETADGAPRYVEVPGEIVDLDWQGPGTLVCLTAETDPALPGLCHARYSLLRIPFDTLQPERLALDPSRL